LRQAEVLRRPPDWEFEQLLDFAPDALVTIAPDGAIMLVNRRLEALFGYTRAELVGEPVETLVPERFRAANGGDRRDQFEDPRTRRMVGLARCGRRKDGSEFRTEISLARVETGEGLSMTASIRDVTETARELERATTELQRSNADLEQFAYAASHDLAEPLRTIGGFAKLLGDRYEAQLDHRGRRYIERIGEGVRRLDALIEGLLVYSRVGTPTIAPEPVSCDEILAGVVAALSDSIESASAEVIVDPLPKVRADPVLLGPVFQNLISNAIKFGDPAGPRVHVSAEREDGGCRFWVRDNGIGIAPRHAERVFRIFQRLHTREEHPGAGIGLALSKAIVERHGGEMLVQPEPGGGSAFSFTVPDRHRRS
jgi:PAS domain S-box-containing protein